MKRDRDPYAECGAAIRQATARAIAAKCTRAELAVLAAVISLTGSYSKLVDRVGHDQVARLAGVHPKTAAAALRTLRACRSIVYRPGSGQGNVSLVGLRKDRTRRGASGRSLYRAEGESIRARRGVSRGSTPEKDRAYDYVDDVELRELLAPLGYLSSTQLDDARAAWRESSEGVERCVRTALVGDRPAALFTSMIRDRAYLDASANGRSTRDPFACRACGATFTSTLDRREHEEKCVGAARDRLECEEVDR